MSLPKHLLTVDVVLTCGDFLNKKVLLIRRGSEPFKGSWALPGGFVEVGEPVATAASRELEEETGIFVPEKSLDLVGIYDRPNRDPRGPVVSVVYTCVVDPGIRADAGDDAEAANWWSLRDLPDLAFDHDEIIADATH